MTFYDLLPPITTYIKRIQPECSGTLFNSPFRAGHLIIVPEQHSTLTRKGLPTVVNNLL